MLLNHILETHPSTIIEQKDSYMAGETACIVLEVGSFEAMVCFI